MGLKGGMNTYAYANDDSVNSSDQFWLRPIARLADQSMHESSLSARYEIQPGESAMPFNLPCRERQKWRYRLVSSTLCVCDSS